LRAADAVIAVSEEDRRQLMALAEPAKPIAVIPNVVAVDDYQWAGPVPDEARFDLVFTGKMDYRPNVDGVLWFAEAIWPIGATGSGRRRRGPSWASGRIRAWRRWATNRASRSPAGSSRCSPIWPELGCTCFHFA
jgi:hypothetical protein